MTAMHAKRCHAFNRMFASPQVTKGLEAGGQQKQSLRAVVRSPF